MGGQTCGETQKPKQAGKRKKRETGKTYLKNLNVYKNIYKKKKRRGAGENI